MAHLPLAGAHRRRGVTLQCLYVTKAFTNGYTDVLCRNVLTEADELLFGVVARWRCRVSHRCAIFPLKSVQSSISIAFGIPVFVSNFIPDGLEIVLHSEQGVLGYGPEAQEERDWDYDLINASGRPEDAVVELERPKLSPYFARMQKKIAASLGLKPAGVSVKAKSGEGMGDVGQGEAIRAQAVALIRKAETGRKK